MAHATNICLGAASNGFPLLEARLYLVCIMQWFASHIRIGTMAAATQELLLLWQWVVPQSILAGAQAAEIHSDATVNEIYMAY